MKTKLASSIVVVLVLATRAHAAGYVAHEWGTFTSVQGSDGQLIRWNPFTAAELPAFVHERNRPLSPPGTNPVRLFTKSTSGAWLQRMETPVIYFYADAPLRVDATVEFPGGLVTEWFPLADGFGPRGEINRSFVRWSGVEVQPGPPSAERAPPVDQSGSHYFAARATDAALVTTQSPVTGNTETEKFLFYRGVGNFEAPLQARFENGELALLNRGAEQLRSLFVLEVRGHEARVLPIESLAVGAELKPADDAGAAFRPLNKVRNELGAALEHELAAAGLYPREAAAMVKTWDDAWFAEPGTRVLYILPRAWTDRVLPLKLEPAPRELARVMVGRAEIFDPAVENAMQREVTLLSEPQQRAALLERLHTLGLGRFTEPAMQRAFALKAAAEKQKEPGGTPVVLLLNCETAPASAD